jgi:hypothetical protein
MTVPNTAQSTKKATRLDRIAHILFVVFLASVVAHGCHPGDHGDADLLIRLAVTAAGSAWPPASP